MGIAVAALVIAAAGTFSQPANAQTAYCWIDAATGQRVTATFPAALSVTDYRNQAGNISSSGHASSSITGQTFFSPDGGQTWTDSATGQSVGAVVPGALSVTDYRNQAGNIQSSKHASSSITGQTFVLVPCPPTQTSMSGSYLGGELAKNWGRVRSTETRDATGVITNQFVDSGDPLGVGIVGGYNFKPWNNNIVIGPFASFDYLNQTINHNFAGGQFLGTTTHWFINAGVKAGVVTAPGFYLYGLAGAAFLNHDLNVNFATAAQSNVTTPGFTLGLGGEYQPSSWQLAGHPVSLFAQYQHTWWSNANFNTPTSSPAFNYAFRREDDTIKLGVNFYFGAAPAPVPPPSPVMALHSK